MFEWYKNFKNNRKKYKGFTLVELLAIILILSLIISIVIIMFKEVFISTEQTINKTEKNIILSAANDYALEYRGTDGWIEEIEEDGTVNFCVSLDSLIKYGYFKNDSSNFEKYKDDYVVEFQIENGVYNYKFIPIVDSSTCKFKDFESSINNSYIKTGINDDKGKSVGEFNYKVDKIDNKNYSLDFDLLMKLKNIVKTDEVYITFILDISSSMEGSKIEKANEAIANFSQHFIDYTDVDVKISLIFFHWISGLARDFSSTPLSLSYLNSIGTTSGTNYGAGLDMAISLMCHRGLDINPLDSQWCANISDVPIDNKKSKKLYAILLFDGEMNGYPYVKIDNGNALADSYEADFDVVKREKYYRNFLNSKQYVRGVNNFDSDFNKYIVPSINRLKNDLDVNLFMIGYHVNSSNVVKQYASVDNKLCIDGYNYGGRTYCYYDSNKFNVNNILSSISDNIINNLGVSSLKFTFNPVKKDGQSLITLINPDGTKVKNNKLEIEIKDLNNDVDKITKKFKGYKFILNDSIYSFCSTEDEKCELKQNLFDVTLNIKYINGDSNSINLDLPSFDLIFTERKTIN